MTPSKDQMTLSEDQLVESEKPAETRKGCNPRQIITQAIEIPLFLTMFCIALSGPPTSNLTLYRTCVHSLNRTTEECQSFLNTSSIDHSNELENEVQKYATTVRTVESVIKAVGPAVLSLFMGVWSDKHGRKPLILWPLVGMTISAVMMVVYSMMESLGPWWLIAPAVPFSLFGGLSIMITGAFCYSSDVSTKENRSIKILFIVMAIAVALTVGGVISPYLLRALGNDWFFFMLFALLALGLVYTIFFLKESLTEAVKGNILTVFDCSHPKEMMRSCFQKKPNYVRAIVLLTVGASSISIFTDHGVNALLYMYVRTKIQWSMTDFTTFSSISAAWAFLGSIVGVGLLQRMLKISDLNFISTAFLTSIIEFIIKGLATTTWHMYLSSAIALFGSISGPLLRSFLTKTVPRTDTAKVFSLLGFTEAFCPLLSPLVYNALYRQTINSFPGAVMIMTAAIFFVCLVMVLIVQWLTRKVSLRQQKVALEDKQNLS